MKKFILAAFMCIGAMLPGPRAVAVTAPAIDPSWSDALYFNFLNVGPTLVSITEADEAAGNNLLTIQNAFIPAFFDYTGFVIRFVEPDTTVSDYLWFAPPGNGPGGGTPTNFYLCSDGAPCDYPTDRQFFDIPETAALFSYGGWFDLGVALTQDHLFDGALLVYSDTTPIPAALPLFATGLGALGLLSWRRKRNKAAATASA